MYSRRQFIKVIGATGAALCLPGRGVVRQLLAQPGNPLLDPQAIPKFVTPLLIPPVMPRAGTFKNRGGKNGDYYEISVKQFVQQILPPGFPATTVWGYGPVTGMGKNPLLIHHAPSLTIEAQAGRPVRIKWINDLKDPAGNYLPHLLPVDPTLHWANPGGGPAGRDRRPGFSSTPGPYTGPVPIVTHVHGAVGVGDESDGYAEAWYLPAASNIPAGYATEGTWYEFFAAKAAGRFGAAWGPGFAVFEYPNLNRACTLWYHDHALGMTRLNVYAGPAGFYIIRGGPSGDAAVLDVRTGRPAVLPGPAPKEGDKFPPNKTYYEIPIAIQDRAFHADGALFYPDSREYFDGATASEPGFIPETDLPPIWNPEFFGNTIIVNGRTWPFLNVEQRRYRFRFLNGCQSRFLILDFSGIPGVEVWQIGNEGGFLPAPVNLTALGSKLPLNLAERADVIVDFTNVPVGSYVLRNLGPDEPFKGFNPDGTLADGEGGALPPADPATTGQILAFNVGPALAPDLTTPPMYLQLPPVPPLPMPVRTRPLALLEEMSMYWDGPAAALLGNVEMGMATHRMWMDPVTENPNVGDTEVWEFYNFTADAHPIHIHAVVFEVLDRQPISFEQGEMGHIHNLQLAGPPRPPEPWEAGFKDTVTAFPGEVVRVRARFDTPGQFVWHCHIVEHEDNEMMRPYRIGPVQPGQPA